MANIVPLHSDSIPLASLDAMERKIISRLVSGYRDPEASGDLFYGLAAELSVLDALRSERRSAARIAKETQQKDIARATQSD